MALGGTALSGAQEFPDGVEAGVLHLAAERAAHASADDQFGGAMQKRPNRKHQPGVLARCSAEAAGERVEEKTKGGPRLVERGRCRNAVKQNYVHMAVLLGKLEITATCLFDSA